MAGGDLPQWPEKTAYLRLTQAFEGGCIERLTGSHLNNLVKAVRAEVSKHEWLSMHRATHLFALLYIRANGFLEGSQAL